MKIKELDAEYTYDFDLDIVNIQVKQEYTYKESVDLDVGVFLDFDENDFPVNLEILSASKRLDIEKELLINPQGNVKIIISSDLIELNVNFLINDNNYLLQYCDRHCENLKIADTETSFALV
ncbi:DUF2283 domain-containing protein [Methanobrevibacter millerae]|uniref:Uncharacterized protein YuzE n=1 Tax=Methanobrevibacter millerae TaxID=230361 RepID=A0A1G5VCP7_9EURY|nr:DUF2283 domain-containing protein [Methanobrevibacter millerae]SDA43653.1 Uncharacterized protein YuzE [Methanobrevibacter millerae]